MAILSRDIEPVRICMILAIHEVLKYQIFMCKVGTGRDWIFVDDYLFALSLQLPFTCIKAKSYADLAY